VSRRRQSLIEEVLETFVELPIWASILGGAVFYVAFRFVPPLFAGTSMTGKIVATVLPQVAPWGAIAILAAGLIGVGKRQWKRHLLSRATGLMAIREMPWADFEALMAEIYRRQGYLVRGRGGRQADGGIDLELSRGMETVIVQCKHWLNRRVPVHRVRELLGVVTAEGADRGILVATSGFTPDALEFAAGKPLELVDADGLLKLVHLSTEPSAGPH
jgi:restriction system protein